MVVKVKNEDRFFDSLAKYLFFKELKRAYEIKVDEKGRPITFITKRVKGRLRHIPIPLERLREEKLSDAGKRLIEMNTMRLVGQSAKINEGGKSFLRIGMKDLIGALSFEGKIGSRLSEVCKAPGAMACAANMIGLDSYDVRKVELKKGGNIDLDAKIWKGDVSLGFVGSIEKEKDKLVMYPRRLEKVKGGDVDWAKRVARVFKRSGVDEVKVAGRGKADHVLFSMLGAEFENPREAKLFTALAISKLKGMKLAREWQIKKIMITLAKEQTQSLPRILEIFRDTMFPRRPGFPTTGEAPGTYKDFKRLLELIFGKGVSKYRIPMKGNKLLDLLVRG